MHDDEGVMIPRHYFIEEKDERVCFIYQYLKMHLQDTVRDSSCSALIQ
jgi:hypothetical protein